MFKHDIEAIRRAALWHSLKLKETGDLRHAQAEARLRLELVARCKKMAQELMRRHMAF